MAIIFPKDPEGGQKVVRDFISHTLLAGPCILKNVEIKDLTIANAHQSYTFSTDEKKSRISLSNAKPISWQYFIMRGDEALALARLKSNGSTLKVTELQAPATALNLALKRAQQLPQVKIQDYEFRFLNLRPFLRAAWIHSLSDDIVYLLPPTYQMFDSNTPYSEEQFIEFLKLMMAGGMTEEEYKKYMKQGDIIRQNLIKKCKH